MCLIITLGIYLWSERLSFVKVKIVVPWGTSTSVIQVLLLTFLDVLRQYICVTDNNTNRKNMLKQVEKEKTVKTL